MSIDGNWADEEWRHDCLWSDERPRRARRAGLTQEQYDEADDDLRVYDPQTGQWS